MKILKKTSVVDIHKINGKRPDYDIYIGRKVRNTEFVVGTKWGNYNMTLKEYEEFARKRLWDDLDELVGKRLGCWCITTDKTEPTLCHGQVLMKLVQEKFEM